MMRQKIVAGNWKMNGREASIRRLLDTLLTNLPANNKAETVVIPPALYLPLVAGLIQESPLSLGAQNVYPAKDGAFTGEINAGMLQDYNCRYVLVGHSERRTLFVESEKFIAEKFHHVKEHGMIPVLCVGETLAERETGLTKDVLARQLQAVVSNNPDAFQHAVVAYEPVWAIGTGVTAAPEQVQDVHMTLRTLISELGETHGTRVTILYGGSVNEKNAQALFAMPDVDGGLIGGASLNAQQFLEIVSCIN